MKLKAYLGLSTLIFATFLVFHVLRIVYRWPAQIGGFEVPMGVSWVVIVVAGYLAYSGYKLQSGK